MEYGSRLTTSVCPACKKAFDHFPEHGYLFRGKPCCTYSCMRKLEIKHEKPRKPETPERMIVRAERRRKKAPSQADINNIILMRLKGADVQKISSIMHRPHNTIRSILKDAGLVVGTGHSKRNNELMQIIHEMNMQGKTADEIAKMIGVRPVAVGKYR